MDGLTLCSTTFPMYGLHNDTVDSPEYMILLLRKLVHTESEGT